MKALPAMLISLTVTASRVLASSGAPEGGRSGLMTECLIALLVMIVVFQFIPGMTLFVGMLKAMFAPGKRETQASPASEE